MTAKQFDTEKVKAFVDAALVESARDPEAETIRIDRSNAEEAARWIDNRIEAASAGGKASKRSPSKQTKQAKRWREYKRRYREKKAANNADIT